MEFSPDLDTFELMDAIDAIDNWEHQFEREHKHLKDLIENVVCPEEIPQEAKDAFNVWIKNLKRREQELKNKMPDRKERATIMKTKLIIQKRKLAKKSEDTLEELPPEARPRHPELD